MESTNTNLHVMDLPAPSFFRYVTSGININTSGYPLVAFYFSEEEGIYYYDCAVYLPDALHITNQFPTINFTEANDILQVQIILCDYDVPDDFSFTEPTASSYSLYIFSASFSFAKKIKASNTTAQTFKSMPTQRGTYTVVSDPKPEN